MKKILLMTFAFLFTIASINAQRVLLDFEEEQQSFVECFGVGSQDPAACFDVIANPDASGINTSDSVGVFIEPTEGETWAGFIFDIVNGGDVDLTTATGNTELCADVWVPTGSGGDFTFKVERLEGGLVTVDRESPAIKPSAEGQWATVCSDMAIFDAQANRLVLFFNIQGIPITETSYYVDNVTQPGVTSVGGLIEEKGLKIFPNPATYDLFFNADGEPMTITVADLQGRELIRHASFTGNSIRVADLIPGSYIITFTEESTGRFGSTKFFKQ
ncbi:MAG: T9SS type A sorting domain-containing protein [Bacteroidota bacterium]